MIEEKACRAIMIGWPLPTITIEDRTIITLKFEETWTKKEDCLEKVILKR